MSKKKFEILTEEVVVVVQECKYIVEAETEDLARASVSAGSIDGEMKSQFDTESSRSIVVREVKKLDDEKYEK